MVSTGDQYRLQSSDEASMPSSYALQCRIPEKRTSDLDILRPREILLFVRVPQHKDVLLRVDTNQQAVTVTLAFKIGPLMAALTGDDELDLGFRRVAPSGRAGEGECPDLQRHSYSGYCKTEGDFIQRARGAKPAESLRDAGMELPLAKRGHVLTFRGFWCASPLCVLEVPRSRPRLDRWTSDR